MNALVKIKSPISVNLEVTPVCDLKCEFCFNANDCSHLEHPSIAKIKAILDALSAAEVFEVRMFGGEFFVYPHWQEVLDYADDLDFFISFVSNGTHITGKTVKNLKSHRVTGGAISLHGLKPVHDKITKTNGSFDLALRGIRACLDKELNISILYTLNKDNHLGIFDMVSWLKREHVNIDQINVSRLNPYGRAKADWENAKLSLTDYLKVFPQLEKIREELGVWANFGDAFPACLVAKKYHEYIMGCWQGTGFAHIDHQGNVRSCSIARGNYGNILEENLIDIWAKKLAHFRSLKWLPAKCQRCKNFCGGGCSASAYDGGTYAPDEFIQQRR